MGDLSLDSRDTLPGSPYPTKSQAFVSWAFPNLGPHWIRGSISPGFQGSVTSPLLPTAALWIFEDMAKKAAAFLFLTVAFLQMALCQDTEKKKLRCYFCGYEQACTETSVLCQEGEKCSTMLGHSDYKVHESIFGKGCISAQKCGSQDKITYWRNPFRVTYSCCDSDYCNKEVFGAGHKGISGAGRTSLTTHLPWLFAATLLAALLACLS
ncbi:uncharacterized protein LOC129328377 [Eublepharis macularius]|uniref:Uncharacterized protein LOC129328377 n=1 Tax=Eublepharis macularius TaxID=481883 RepID=A0AA97J9I8_EUBMA|nr:uncharacterized protein LOC129328377 [Eublepharis macularius]